jgi:tetratricopeptide (TPR) repeat protein
MSIALSQQLARARNLVDSGRLLDALHAFRRLVQDHPEAADAWYEYAWLLRRSGQPIEALDAYATALRKGISGAEEVHLNRAVILSEDLRDVDAARSELSACLCLSVDYPPALLNLGKLEEDLGDNDAAVSCYSRLIALPGAPALALEALSRLVQIEPPAHAQLDRLQRLEQAADDPAHSLELRAGVLFALGRCAEAANHHLRAFDAFSRANRLVAQGGPAYLPQALEMHVDRVRRAELPALESAAPEAAPSAQPLFICGMFRSGSTLLEQVLNAHPGIIAAGELPFFPRLAAGALAAQSAGAHLPEAIAEGLRRDYRNLLDRIAPAKGGSVAYVSDKRPDNILLLSLIRQVFPGSRILITRRDPMDTGLSVFQQHLSQVQAPYSSDLAHIGHFQGQVDKLTRHALDAWPRHVRTFDYDSFVRNPEQELRPLLAWLGLAWEPACLSFHEQRNVVATASHAQVRQPLYRKSSGRWRVYARELEPLARGLEWGGYSPDTR